jgi:hypothetical protein
MNRNLRAAQSAAHLQKGALKAIHMNQNLRAAQSTAHLQKGALKSDSHESKFKSCSKRSPPTKR